MNDQYTVSPKPAHQGSIDRFQTSCPRCGMHLTSSFEGILVTDMTKHLDYHDRKDGGRAS